MKRVFNDSTIEIALTVFTCYITFWTAESSGLHVSGILALVALGLYMSGFGRTYISAASESDLHAFWKFMGWVGETMIFLLSGVIIGSKVFLGSKFQLVDLGKLILFYVCLNIIRAFIVGIFYPIMRRIGYGTSLAESFVLVYGGLRGAVGLALALMVFHEEFNEEIKEMVVFHTAGIATLTLLVNGTTTGYFIGKFGLAKVSPI
jgi:NhaP-type Na+/H+ or K+/H+ antiporter